MRLEVSYIDHPKFLALSDGAFRLWHEGKSYCEKHLTDGLIPTVAARGFRHFTKLRVGELQSLVAGYRFPLWETHQNGFQMHDYLAHNDGREVARARIDRSIEERASNQRLKILGRDRGLVDLVRNRDGDQCRYCGRIVNWTDRRGSLGGTYDHVKPNGLDTLENVVVACRSCNSIKGNRSLSEIAERGMQLRPISRLGIKPEPSPIYQAGNKPESSPSPSSSSKKEQI